MGMFLAPEGYLLGHLYPFICRKCPEDGIYKVPLEKKEIPTLFFRYPGYEQYGYPFLQDGKFFCVGYHSDDWENYDVAKRSALFMAEDARRVQPGSAEILVETIGTMESPVLSDDLRYVYYRKYENQYLYKFDRETKTESKVSDDDLERGANILLLEDQSVIYGREGNSSMKYYGYDIVQVKKDGERKVLIENASKPIWYEKEKVFLYSNGKKNYFYDLQREESVEIEGSTENWLRMPQFSPDKQYLVGVGPTRHLAYFIGERLRRYYITTLNGQERLEFTWLPYYLSEEAAWWCRKDEIE